MRIPEWNLPPGELREAAPPIPDRIKIGPKYYTVHTEQASWDNLRLQDAELENYIGHTDNNALTIHLKPGSAFSEYQDTLLHEVLHAVWAQGGAIGELMTDVKAEDREEYLVSRQSPWLLQVLQDNPQLVAWLTWIDA